MSICPFQNHHSGSFQPDSCQMGLLVCTDQPTLSEGRLYERDGVIQLIPKSPAEVVGERVLRPLIDLTYQAASSVFDSIKSKVMTAHRFVLDFNLLPVAHAESIPQDSLDEAQNVLYSCSLTDGFAQIEKMPLLPDRPQIASSELEVEPNTKTQKLRKALRIFKTSAEALQFLHDDGVDTTQFQPICLLQNDFNRLTYPPQSLSLKTSQNIRESMDALSVFVKEGDLRGCESNISPLLTAIKMQTTKYPLEILGRFPDLLLPMLERLSGVYSIRDFSDDLTTLHDISQEVIEKIRHSDETHISPWISLLIDTSKRDPKLLKSTFKLATTLFQSGKADAMTWKFQKYLRRLATLSRVNTMNDDEANIVEKFLKVSGSQNFILDTILSFLESLEYDFIRIERQSIDLRSLLVKSLLFKELLIAIACLLEVIVVPFPWKLQFLVAILACFVAMEIYYLPQC